MGLMQDLRPGLGTARLANLITAAVARCELDLTGATVLTEAATGPYAVTPVLAAVGGADRVFAVTRNTRYGTVKDVTDGTMELARAAGVAQSVEVIAEKRADVIAQADIITNSGHVRPLDAHVVGQMK